jgi:hypothetical protein
MVLGQEQVVQRQRRKCCTLDGIRGNPIWFDWIPVQFLVVCTLASHDKRKGEGEFDSGIAHVSQKSRRPEFSLHATCPSQQKQEDL